MSGLLRKFLIMNMQDRCCICLTEVLNLEVIDKLICSDIPFRDAMNFVNAAENVSIICFLKVFFYSAYLILFG